MSALDQNAKERVSEFVRQWNLHGNNGDRIHAVYFDAAKDEEAPLLASDLRKLVAALEAVRAIHSACYGGAGCETTAALDRALGEEA